MPENLQYYLDAVPLPVLLLGPVAVIVAILAVPSWWRRSVAIGLMVPWMVVSRMPDLGFVRALAKATGFGAFLLIIIAALMHPGPRRRLPGVAWLYLFAAVIGLLFTIRVVDRSLAVVLQVQWILLVAAAAAVVRTIVDESDVRSVLWALTVGLALAVLVPLSDLVLHPGAAIRAGFGRFAPYGANANQVGVVFAMATPLSLYFAITTRNALVRPVLFAAAAAAAGLALLTASRSSIGIMAIASLPLAAQLTRRPILLGVGVLVLFVGLSFVLGRGEGTNFARLASLETSRGDIARHYLGIIADRPVLGLLETSGESFSQSETERFTHPHNAYLLILFRGGIVYALPMLIAMGWSLFAAFRVWRGRRRLTIDPPLVMVILALLVLSYGHGLVNAAIIHPTYAWAFLQVLLSISVVAIAGDLKQAALLEQSAAADDEAFAHDLHAPQPA